MRTTKNPLIFLLYPVVLILETLLLPVTAAVDIVKATGGWDKLKYNARNGRMKKVDEINKEIEDETSVIVEDYEIAEEAAQTKRQNNQIYVETEKTKDNQVVLLSFLYCFCLFPANCLKKYCKNLN